MLHAPIKYMDQNKYVLLKSWIPILVLLSNLVFDFISIPV